MNENLLAQLTAPTTVGSSDVLGGKRLALCKSLVKSVATIRDGRDHSDKVNRCMVITGECVGYYSVLIDYDEQSDTFGVGWKQRAPAAQVDEIALFDALSQVIELVNKMAHSLPPNDQELSHRRTATRTAQRN